MGREVVARELTARGASVRDAADGPVPYLHVDTPDGRRVRIRVKTRRSGVWQASVSAGITEYVPPAVPTFWAFVDLSAERAVFYVARDESVRRDIAEAHQRYLVQHGGHRPDNDASNHHAIHIARVEQWRDRWDLLGL